MATRLAAPLSPCVCNTLRMVTRAVTQLYDETLRPSGLRATQFSVLTALARRGEANVKELTDALAIDQTTLTRGLTVLERGRLIERVPHPDRRIKALRLTPAGARALAVARPLWTRAQQRVIGQWGARSWRESQRRLARLLHVAVERRRPARRRRRPRPAS